MLGQRRTFKGGYRFKNYRAPALAVIAEAKIPEQALVPLKQEFGEEPITLVKKGDKVLAGQIIARADETTSNPVHSPINGTVEDLCCICRFNQPTTVIVIRASDSSNQIQRLNNHTKDWPKLSTEKLEELIYLSGAAGLGASGIPTRFKSSSINPKEAKHLIIHGVESEAYNKDIELTLNNKEIASPLLGARNDTCANFIEGIQILKKILGQVSVHLTINAEKPKLIKTIKTATAKLEWLKIYPLAPKYPQEHPTILAKTIGIEIASSQKARLAMTQSHDNTLLTQARNDTSVILSIDDVLDVYKAVVEGMPIIERTIALSGPNWTKNIHLKTRIGTTLGEALKGRLKATPHRLILNSIFTGPKLDDLSQPIDRSFQQIIAIPEKTEREFLSFVRPRLHGDSYSKAFLSRWLPKSIKTPDTNQHGEERPCISCGYCGNICPAGIIPHLLYKYVKAEIIDEKIMQYGIFDCIECGLCTFACPSKIQLLKYLKIGKEKLIEEGFVKK